MAVSYQLPIIASQFSVKRASKSSLLALALTLFASATSYAHQPVSLQSESKKPATSPVLVDGTISFAVNANFSKKREKKYFRFALNSGERLKLEYLILDRAPENRLSNKKLPIVTIITPSGITSRLNISERTPFYEPYGGANYFFLARTDSPGETGIYTVKVSAREKSTAIIAVGAREIRGEVMEIGSTKGTCPMKIEQELEISIARGSQLVGFSERAGEICATLNNWIFRTIQRDGRDLPATKDYRTNRVNASVRNGQITEISIG